MKRYYELITYHNGMFKVYQIPHNVNKVRARRAINAMHQRERVASFML